MLYVWKHKEQDALLCVSKHTHWVKWGCRQLPLILGYLAPVEWGFFSGIFLTRWLLIIYMAADDYATYW